MSEKPLVNAGLDELASRLETETRDPGLMLAIDARLLCLVAPACTIHLLQKADTRGSNFGISNDPLE